MYCSLTEFLIRPDVIFLFTSAEVMADGIDPICGVDEGNRTEGTEDNASKPTLGDKKGLYLKQVLVYLYCHSRISLIRLFCYML